MLLAALLALFAPACGRSEGEDRHLLLTGSSTVAPLASEIARRFEATHPGVRVDVQAGGSSRGIADARRGTADLGMISRDLAPDERDLVSFPLARDGITIMVHARNPVRELSRDDVRRIYSGGVRRWTALGGHDAPITVVHKAEGRATLEVFLEWLGMRNSAVRADVVIGHNRQAIKTVAGNPDALGYVSIGAARAEIADGASIRLLPLEGRAPTLEGVRSGAFPLARTLHLVCRGEPRALARRFVEFARSEEVHDLFEAYGFSPALP